MDKGCGFKGYIGRIRCILVLVFLGCHLSSDGCISVANGLGKEGIHTVLLPMHLMCHSSFQ